MCVRSCVCMHRSSFPLFFPCLPVRSSSFSLFLFLFSLSLSLSLSFLASGASDPFRFLFCIHQSWIEQRIGSRRTASGIGHTNTEGKLQSDTTHRQTIAETAETRTAVELSESAYSLCMLTRPLLFVFFCRQFVVPVRFPTRSVIAQGNEQDEPRQVSANGALPRTSASLALSSLSAPAA